jgi:hypothetical protein
MTKERISRIFSKIPFKGQFSPVIPIPFDPRSRARTVVLAPKK